MGARCAVHGTDECLVCVEGTVVVEAIALERQRIERELRALFEANIPLPARPLAAFWIAKVEKIIRGEEGR